MGFSPKPWLSLEMKAPEHNRAWTMRLFVFLLLHEGRVMSAVESQAARSIGEGMVLDPHHRGHEAMRRSALRLAGSNGL